MNAFVGTPSDNVDAILATGRGDISRVFLSMARRHPEGNDADYLAWHTLDHRPEQHRLAELRASLRLVSTPECRAARAASASEFDEIDHVMTYFFSNDVGLDKFNQLSIALRSAGRAPFILPPVQRGVYEVGEAFAAPRIKAGADVLPWWPLKAAYLIVEDGPSSVEHLLEVPGVGGLWSILALQSADHPDPSRPGSRQQITYCFLDDDPVAVANRLRPLLAQHWQENGKQALLAAPFEVVVPHRWDRHLP